MLIVLASRADPVAAEFTTNTARELLVTPEDLSRPGWRLVPGDPSAITGVSAGRRFSANEVSLVVCRLPTIDERELSHIIADDRAYVAAEMTAFLVAFLIELEAFGVAVLNPPRHGTLGGPPWSAEHWRRAAVKAGLPLGPLRETQSKPTRTITLLDGSIISGHPPPWPSATRRLAQLAGVRLLTVSIVEDHVAGAHAWPALEQPQVAEVLRQLANTRG
jgi:hypothetical protein